MSGFNDPGHSVLAVPVPALEEFVRARTRHYDSAYLSPEAGFAHAHITVLAPWLRTPGPADLRTVARVCAGVDPFHYRLDTLDTFPDGIIHATVRPPEGFGSLTARLRAEFPALLPYEGRYGEDVRPHLTLDAIGPGVDVATVGGWTAGLLPGTALAERLQLQWWQAGRCHVQHEWSLGTEGPA